MVNHVLFKIIIMLESWVSPMKSSFNNGGGSMMSCLVNGEYVEASVDLDRSLNYHCPACKEPVIL